MVNNGGDVVMGFSGAGPNDYISSFCVGRVSTDAAGFMSAVKTLHQGEAAYSFIQWGDYSHTTLDPIDSHGIWTIQQYARQPGDAWQTWIGEIVPLTP